MHANQNEKESEIKYQLQNQEQSKKKIQPYNGSETMLVDKNEENRRWRIQTCYSVVTPSYAQRGQRNDGVQAEKHKFQLTVHIASWIRT